jgi:hypothetical protein
MNAHTNTHGQQITRPRVHFSNDADEHNSVQVSIHGICSLSDFTRAEKAAAWYQSYEYGRIKQLAKSTARGIRDRESNTKIMECTYSSVLEAAYISTLDSKTNISENDMVYLEHWTAVGHSRRGLERWSIPAMEDSRRKHRASAIKSVMEMQRACQFEPEMISQVYKKKSKSAGRFAALMGQADQAAASIEYGILPSVANTTKATDVVSHDRITTSGQSRWYQKLQVKAIALKR